MTWNGFFNGLGAVVAVVGVFVVGGVAFDRGTAAIMLAFNFGGAAVALFAVAAIFARLDAILLHLRCAPARSEPDDAQTSAAP